MYMTLLFVTLGIIHMHTLEFHFQHNGDAHLRGKCMRFAEWGSSMNC